MSDRNILSHVGKRVVMKAIALYLINFERKRDAAAFLSELYEEIGELNSREFPTTYKQAVEGFEGVTSYALERLGFWPASNENEIDE